MKNPLINNKGITLIELLVAIALSSIVALGLYSFFNTQNKLFAGEQDVMQMNSRARTAMDFLSKRIRHLGYNPNEDATTTSSGPTFGLRGDGTTTVVTSNTSIRFTADINGDETLDNNSDEIIYIALSGTELQLGTIDAVTGARDGWQTVTENITVFTVTYIYKDGTQSSGAADLPSDAVSNHNLEDIRGVTISVTSTMENPHNLTNETSTETVTSTITLRNVTGS